MSMSKEILGSICGAIFGVSIMLGGIALAYPRADQPVPAVGGNDPNSVVYSSKAQMGARRLFTIGACEVWGFNWKDHDHVIAVCPNTGKGG